MGLLSGIKHIVGGLTGATAAHAAKGAAAAQAAAQQAAIDEYNKGYTGQQALWSPLRDFGMGAVGGLNALAKGDYSGFENSPDYNVAMRAGTDQVNALAGKLGNLFAGQRATAITDKAQDTASGFLNNYRNSLFNQLGFGQNATSALSGALGNTTQGIANARLGIGDAQAGGQIGAANAWGNGAANLVNLGSSIFGAGGTNSLTSKFKNLFSGSSPGSGYSRSFMQMPNVVQ